MKILCQICTSHIATADQSDLSIPITGDMLKSPYPERMNEVPFPPADWEFLRCPVCGYRPFLNDSEVLTDQGIYVIPVPEPTSRTITESLYICSEPGCGKVFETAKALRMHKIGKARAGKKKKEISIEHKNG